MDDITITNGDRITVAKNEDGYPAVKIQNAVWVEEPRWLHFAVAGSHDNDRAIDDMIAALSKLKTKH
jgi:hypothetical protein